MQSPFSSVCMLGAYDAAVRMYAKVDCTQATTRMASDSSIPAYIQRGVLKEAKRIRMEEGEKVKGKGCELYDERGMLSAKCYHRTFGRGAASTMCDVRRPGVGIYPGTSLCRRSDANLKKLVVKGGRARWEDIREWDKLDSCRLKDDHD